MSGKIYHGSRASDGHLAVTVHKGASRSPLRKRLDPWNHSPDGFEVGYGSGPAQLALAILADALGDDDLAIRLHQKYKWEVIAKLPKDSFYIPHADVEAFMASAIP